jgi:hypothetical protein
MSIKGLLEKWQIPKSRAIAHLAFSVITAGIWVLPAILLEVFIASNRENKIWENNRKYHESLAKLKQQIQNKSENIEELNRTKDQIKKTLDSQFKTPFELPIAWLWESREHVTSVTSGTTLGKTRTGTVGLGWSDGIGWAASQGVTRGTIASQTTEIINNEFTQLDSGILRIGDEFVAFIGNQFTRTGFYRDVLAINTDYDKGIGLSILNAERIWLTRFPGEFEKEIALSLIQSAYALSIKGEANNCESLLQHFDKHKDELEAEIQSLNIQIEERNNQDSRPE